VAKDDNWYWKCEPALVLADEDLGLCPSPDGWPDEGLSCVGLYFYMLCLMYRSPRRGFLLEPDGTPMTAELLAKLIRRSPETVVSLQTILLSRNLFSATAHGVIFSRGMVKREQERLRYSASGKKGGKERVRRETVLKHSLKHSTKHALTVAVESKTDNDSDSKKAPPPSRAGPGYFPFKTKDAKAVVDAYQREVGTEHAPAGALNAVLEIIGNDEATKEELLVAVKAWAPACRKANADPGKRMSAVRWFRDGCWRDFVDGDAVLNGQEVPDDETPEQRNARIAAFNLAAKKKAGVL
jgi:hypothetical protein